MRTVIRFLTPLVLLLAMLLPAGGASAAPAQTTRTETFMFTFNDCNGGEGVLLQGFVQTVSYGEPDGTFFFLINLHGQGIGDQGNEYVLNETFHVRQSPPNSFSFDDRVRLIRNGSETNQYVKVHFSDSGSSFDFDCRG